MVASAPNRPRSIGAGDAAGQSERVRIFAERMFARLAPELAEEYPIARRLELAARGLEFFSSRPEPVKLLATPSDRNDGLVTVNTAMPDCPFIVDSVLEYFRARELPVRILLHPLFSVSRGENGEILKLEQRASGERLESFIHAEIELSASPADCALLEHDLRRVLIQVQEATEDFGAMTARALQICEETAALRELVEVRDFLRWLVQGGFVFLGYRRYQIDTVEGRSVIIIESGSSLGIMRSESRSRFSIPTPLDSLDAPLRRLLFDGPALTVGKTRAVAEVHRRAPMEDITIRRTEREGRVVGFDRFIGLFTSKAYAEEGEHIPVLRAKLRELIEAEGLQEGTYDYKATVAAFNSLPKEELFRAKTAELRQQLRLILDVESEAEVRLGLTSDAARGVVVALVTMPRERFSAEVRMKVQKALGQALGGRLIYYFLALGEGYTARLHFCFAASPPPSGLTRDLEAEIARLAQSWDDLLRDRLIEKLGPGQGREVAARWLSACAPAYKTGTAPELALVDIDQIEQLDERRRFSVLIGAAFSSSGPDTSELRFYEYGEAPILSELVPLLQNFGISVISEEAHEFNLTASRPTRSAHLQVFRVRTIDGKPLERLAGAALIAEALVAVRSGQAEDDALNALTLSAGLSWRETALIRAYLGAAFQMKLAPARLALRRPFLMCPRLARLLVDLLRARLDPDRPSPPERCDELRQAYLAELAAVENIADDRVARTVLAMIEATTRTNYFADSAPYLALKFESAQIPNLPDTAPLYEIYVNSPAMEGCHLRAAKIARGGIRHSDRPDDFRTEILDLMKTQTIKNALIVPMGSKGGFVVKQAAGRTPERAAVAAAYSMLINAMLDLTDNLVEGQIVHPPRVVVRDTDGAYLVVAADKGTADFSDLANSIALSRGFWLGDAFASGGEHGYDHKKMGITARGAWESAKRHLRDLGRDFRHGAPITVVGIGDMSGDVFGNGMLQSDRIKLIAAFDHRHIFIDPDPDPARSFAERQRLQRLPASQWTDYDQSLISPGGGVFKRGEKRIQLSAAARIALACVETELDSDRLIQAILRAGVDLLFNGGVGTYVRASDETDAQVGDHANDSCRVTANELRCKIAVEGGNLGFTQKARIEYALAGGRINTDAIDNSAGVDMSDHEVNLKILLQPAIARGTISETRRNRLLAEVGEQVAADVLRDNRDQALLLSLEQVRSQSQWSCFREHLSAIEQRGNLRQTGVARALLEEMNERRTRYPALTRPELAVLTALTKIDLAITLAASALVEDEYLVERFLRPYFPSPVADAFPDEIPRHRLHRELAATRVVNELVDLFGSLFVHNLTSDFAIDTTAAARVWLIASGLLDLRARVEELHRSAADIVAEAEVAAFLALERPVRAACAWAVAVADPAAPIGKFVARFKPELDRLLQTFETTLTGSERDCFERTYRELRSAVHQEQLAHELARLTFAGHLLNVLNLSLARSVEPMMMASCYFGMSERFEFGMLEAALDSISSEDPWERRAARDLRSELISARSQLCCAIIAQASNGGASPLPADRRAAEVLNLMADLRKLPAIGLAPLQVTIRALTRLAEA